MSLRFAFLAPSSILAHSFTLSTLVSKHMKGPINGKTEAKHVSLKENTLLSQSSPKEMIYLK